MSGRLGRKKKNELAQQQAGALNASAFNVAVQRTETRRAPIPQAAELREYRDLDEKLYDAIVNEFLANGAHRRKIEAENSATTATLVRAVTRNDTTGLWFSALYSVLCLGIATWFIYIGKPTAALLGVLGLIPQIIGVFRRRIQADPPNQQK